ncbi:MAG: MarR family transcriptional regulator [Phycisphaeraceae bacterium]|nr:MarR family transcriptional regulator [Phycisphaeraceae bacterium]
MTTTTDTTKTSAPRNLQEEIGKKHPFDDIREEVMLSLIRTTDQFTSQFKQLFGQHGLSDSSYNVLRIVGARGKQGIPSQSISKDMVHRDPDVTRLIDRLVKLGFVERQRCEEDRRVVYVIITDKGTQTLKTLKNPVKKLHEQQLGHLSDAKLKKLTRLLFEARNP